MVNKQSFIKGTIILMAANAISKILGAVFKIPLTYLLREEGMAIYNTAFNVYIMLLSFIISGMPLAISKIIAEESELGHVANVKKIMTVSTLLLGVLGFAGSLILWFGADFFAYAMKEPKAFFCLKVIAPAIFFVAVGTAYKSFYQGRSNMTPTAISQVIEAFIKLLAGFGLALFYSRTAVEYTAAAAIMGVTIGEIIATFILFILYIPHYFRLPSKNADMPSKKIIDSILLIAVPSVIASVISGAMNLVDITVIRRCIEAITFTAESAEKFLCRYSSYTDVFDNIFETYSISPEGSRWLYGSYSGYALTVFHLPVGILASLGVSILPIIASALAVNNNQRVNACIAAASKITLLICLPAAFCIALFSEPILSILFRNTASAQMLQYLAPCLVFITLAQLFGVIANAGGQIITPFIFAFIGAVIKIIFNIILIRIPDINMLGTAISADIAYFVVMLLSYISIKQHFGFNLSLLKIALKPLFCAAVAAGVMYAIYNPFTIIFRGEILPFAMCGAVGTVSYLLALICSGAISSEEMCLLHSK